MANSIIAVTMPKWGIEMTEGIVAGWRVGVGQQVERGAEILDVETEKIVNAVEAPAAGVLRRILTGDGETYPVGALIGVIAGEQTSDDDISRFVDSFVAAVVSFDPDATVVTGAPAAAGAAAGGAQIDGGAHFAGGAQNAGVDDARVSPIARRIAERLGVDLSKISGTGRNGRISKEDVEAHAAQFTATVVMAAPATHRRIPMSARRITIARRLLESKQTIPHFRLDIDVDLGALLVRKRVLSDAVAERITVNDLLLRATALALVRHPMVNAQLQGDEILQFDNADIAIAVAAEAGLVTPIVRSANSKPAEAIARESRDLIERARLGTLRREEISGGSFTISNLGMFGITRFDAIINAPQVAILAVGAAGQRAVVRGGAVAIAQVVTLTLSADHRVVDGAVGAAFLATLRGLLEQPDSL